MANQLYSFNYGSYASGTSANVSTTSKYFPRSVTDPYIPTNPSDTSLLTSSRYLSSSDPMTSSSMIFNLTDSYSVTTSRIPGLSVASSPPTHFTSHLSWPGPPGVDVGVGSASAATDYYAGLKRPVSDAIYHQNITGTYNTIGQNEALFSTNPFVKRPRFESACNLPVYPQRPGEKDCAHYMLTRTCKYGDSCKFDHPIWVPEGGIPDWKEVPLSTTVEPLPERPGEPDCPYFLKTLRCKFGSKCKFNHPQDSAPLVASENIDFENLPERPSEPLCTFYMKTGKCKFGMACKFHHPKDLQVLPAGPENIRMVNTSLDGSETAGDLKITKSLFAPALLHNSKGLPLRQDELDCPFYLKTGSCKFGATCRYNHPERNTIYPAAAAVALGPSTAQHLNIGVVPAPSFMQTFDPRITQTTLQLGLSPAIYPQRPGDIECDFYMKTGECKFGQRCKFHHPFDRTTPSLTVKDAQQQNVKLSLAGLPRREGAINCPYYMKTGTCKYGATCRFDHPSPGEVMALASLQGTEASSGGGQGKDDDEKAAETS